MIFYSCLLHRGIFTENKKHRRLIQVFDICKTPEEFDYYLNRSYHVPGDEKFSDFMIELSKNKFLVSIPNFFFIYKCLYRIR